MKKRLIMCILSLLMIASFNGGIKTFAMEKIASTPIEGVIKENTDSRAEKVEIFYRTYNGVRQMRIWSYDQNKWITEWTNV